MNLRKRPVYKLVNIKEYVTFPLEKPELSYSIIFRGISIDAY